MSDRAGASTRTNPLYESVPTSASASASASAASEPHSSNSRALRTSSPPSSFWRWRAALYFIGALTAVLAGIAFLSPEQHINDNKMPHEPEQDTHTKRLANLAINATVVPIKSESDEREYRLITLPNRLRCLIISDPSTDKESAAMDVNVGHFEDPAELPGLAHFLEHMLFLGTEKYPDENSYAAFINQAGGYSNAYTGHEDTNYYFDVASGNIREAIDRFSQFFVAPLFSEGSTERELNAVDSEHSKNLLNDQWRGFQLLKSSGNPNSAFSKFGTGSKQTLWDTPLEQGIDTRKRLLEFYQKHYSANRMCLAVLSKLPLDEIEVLVAEKFSLIEDVDAPQPLVSGLPFDNTSLGMVFRVVPVKDVRTLTLCWQFPAIDELYRVKPCSLMSHLIGHESKGSILSVLKERNWATSLSSGVSFSASAFAIFSVSIDLSEQGLEHVLDCVKIVFDYIRLLQSIDSDTLRRLHQEVKDIAVMNFRFAEKRAPASYCSALAKRMRLYPDEEVLSGPVLFQKYDESIFRRFFELLSLDQFRIDIESQQFEGKTTLKERWYGTDYSVEPIPADLLKSLKSSNATAGLALPSANDFIATNFSLRREKKEKDGEATFSSSPGTVPLQILDEPTLKLWHKLDDVFYKPKLNVFALYTTPAAYSTPRVSVLSQLYTRLLEDSLNEFAYDAELAGLEYSLDVVHNGLQLSVRGYNQKLEILLRTIAERMVALEIDDDKFELIRDELLRSFENFSLEQPYQHVVYFHGLSTETPRWHRDRRIAVIQTLTPDDVRQHKAELIASGHWEVFVFGNALSSEAESLARILQQEMPGVALPGDRIPELRVAQLPNDVVCRFFSATLNPDERNSATMVNMQIGADSIANRARIGLLSHIASEPCFNQLRTIEQLGYLVFSGVQQQRGVLSYRIIVQSPERSSEYLRERIEAFIDQIQSVIEGLSDAEYSDNVEAVCAKVLEKDKRMSQESSRHWAEIQKHRYAFDRREQLVAHLRQLSKTQLIDFYKNTIARSAPDRRAFVSLVCGNATETATAAESSDRIVSDLNAFKRSLPLYPAFV